MNVQKLCSAMLLAAASFSLVDPAMADAYPTKPVRLVVPFPPGGVLDTLARTMAQPLSRSLSQAVIIDNKPGAGAIIGIEQVARAPADGYTVLVLGSTFTTSAASRPKLPYDPLKDFTAVARLASTPMLLASNPALPAKTVAELVDLARAPSSQLSYATSGAGAPPHLAMEEFKKLAKVNVTHVPYQGGAPAAMATIGGHTNLIMATPAELASHVAAGKLRALAVTAVARTELLGNVPTMAESGYPRFDLSIWFGVWVPAGTPREIVSRLSAELLRAVETPEVRDVLAKQGFAPAPMGPEQFDAFYRAEIGRYARIVKELDLKLD